MKTLSNAVTVSSSIRMTLCVHYFFYKILRRPSEYHNRGLSACFIDSLGHYKMRKVTGRSQNDSQQQNRSSDSE